MAASTTCPHCRKEFSAEPIGDGAQRGYKCPHCKLFVPESRASEPEPEPEPAKS